MQNFENQENRVIDIDQEKENDLIEKRIKKVQNSLPGFFITHFRVIILMLAAILILGTVSITSIDQEADPEVKIPIAVVTTIYPGASPADMENLITDEIENKLEELNGIDLITSTSKLSLSSIVVEFNADADLEDSIRELKDKVDETRGLPDEAEDPVVTQIRANDFPIITFSLVGDLTDTELKKLGEAVQDELEAINGVSEAPLLGAKETEFSVVVDKAVLSRLNISLSQVVGAISAANLDMPLGDITVDQINYNLRTVAKFKSIEDLKKVVVTVVDGKPILLEDVADVQAQFKDVETLSRISVEGQSPVSSVSLQIFKKTGGNILEIVDTAKVKMDELKEDKFIPEHVEVNISNDYSSFIREDLDTLGRSGLQATVLIFIIMLVALSFKEALISLLAIPLTFFMTFIVLYYSGYTLNSMTLYSLVLSLGLLVDTFIVILEGIFHNIREGLSARRAALLSVSHYKKPLLAGTLTTVSAFAPMLLVGGIMGEYLKIMPITIGITLLSSLFISIVVVPAIGGVFLRRGKAGERKISILEKYLTNRLRAAYRKKIISFLKSRKQKVQVSITLLVLFFISLGLLVGKVVPVELFPNIDVDFVYVDIKMPVGTDLDATSELASEVEAKLFDKSDIKNFVTTVGQSSSISAFDSGSSNTHLANISITLHDKDTRSMKSYEIVEQLREELKYINKGEVSVVELTAGPPTGSPVEARIVGDDLKVLDDIANNVIAILKETDGAINISTNQEASPADLTFTLNKDTLAKSGLSVAEVSGLLRTAIFGVTATETTVDGEDIDVVVRLNKDELSSVEEIKNLSVVNNYGQEVKLSYLADFSLEPALSTIRHRDFERTVTVRADLEEGYTPTEVVPDIEKKVEAMGLPTGYTVNFGGELEDIDESFQDLWNSMIVAVLLILIILVLQFNSFRKPVVVLMTLPLMLIGVVFGMLVLHLPFSFPVFLGLISLAGIVVNDAIVLLDKANRNIEERNMLAAEAIADAGDTRLQPILLTSITTMMGVFPLALASEFWVGLSVSIIFGLFFATILQLFVIPMIFLKFEGKCIMRQCKEREQENRV